MSRNLSYCKTSVVKSINEPLPLVHLPLVLRVIWVVSFEVSLCALLPCALQGFVCDDTVFHKDDRQQFGDAAPNKRNKAHVFGLQIRFFCSFS